MKKLWVVACLFAILPISAFAAQKTKSFTLDEPVQVAGKQLKAGQYKLKWDDQNNDGNTSVSFMQNNDVVATAPAQVLHKKNKTNASFEVNNAGGSPKLDRVYFSDEVLEFGGGANQGM
jgi:hypothetical protein